MRTRSTVLKAAVGVASAFALAGFAAAQDTGRKGVFADQPPQRSMNEPQSQELAAREHLLEVAKAIDESTVDLQRAIGKAERHCDGRALIARSFLVDSAQWQQIKANGGTQPNAQPDRPGRDDAQENRRPGAPQDAQQDSRTDRNADAKAPRGTAADAPEPQRRAGSAVRDQGQRLVYEVICAKGTAGGAAEPGIRDRMPRESAAQDRQQDAKNKDIAQQPDAQQKDAGRPPSGTVGAQSADALVVIYVDAQTGEVHAAMPLSRVVAFGGF